ncbi:hypothetical protein NS365_22570 [Aureimonas ureilytica]|uniref:HNH nuclease domain-containing protein n=1 Tax=Aureimonas ureilytica TaxID=401562 RepID=A0A175RE48_9HYPH|nr:HNH endonuclease signature motif containing protein [Aureimonas ureilytica]KTR02067.1 hypothetical protein NS365_22570 [Aureimonas ureilytica]
MSWGFERGKSYRRVDIHKDFGGNGRSGIVTTHKGVVILFGREGVSSYGYANRLRPDGIYEFFGEGQVGPMTMDKGNVAIRDHVHNGNALLAFRILKNGLVQYIGEMFYEQHRTIKAKDKLGDRRDAFVFELRSADAVEAAIDDDDEVYAADPIDVLRQRALAAGQASPSKDKAPRSVIERSRDVRNYILARAKGHCECCGESAPFARPNGTPYLEAHHTHRLSDGGPDLISHVIALHPVCHRRVHHAADGKDFNEALKARMREIEPNL